MVMKDLQWRARVGAESEERSVEGSVETAGTEFVDLGERVVGD